MNRCEGASSLGLGVARLEDDPVETELAAEAGELLRGPAASGVDRSLAVLDEPLWQRAQSAEAAANAEDQIRRLPGEDERGASARHQHSSAVTTRSRRASPRR
jgi:hypothetical protein